MHASANNLRLVLDEATPAEWKEGLSWYPRANAFINDLAAEFDLTVEIVASVVAALSPMNRWGQNMTDARNLIAAWATGAGLDDVSVCTFNGNKRKAWAILNEQDPGLLSGIKVTAFAQNLMGNWNDVTIDRHAFNAAIAHREIVGDRGLSITDKRNRLASEAYRTLAAEVGISPAQLQAIIWLAWRRINVPSRYRDA